VSAFEYVHTQAVRNLVRTKADDLLAICPHKWNIRQVSAGFVHCKLQLPAITIGTSIRCKTLQIENMMRVFEKHTVLKPSWDAFPIPAKASKDIFPV
jgi:hypothetical protein